MQDFHHNRARALLQNAEEIFDKEAVQSAVRSVADTLNARFSNEEEFPLVLGVMGGAVVFTGSLLPQLTSRSNSTTSTSAATATTTVAAK
jgi:hypoxanthine phosphoribosyltransferase